MLGRGYASYRQPEPAIERIIGEALGDARTVLNVGAGAGSYEPPDRDVTTVEPSGEMRAQRPAHLSAAIDARAERLPFADGQFAASMATSTIHQWTDLAGGLREMRRVTRGPVVLLTSDPELLQRFWLNAYSPGVLAAEARRHPALPEVTAHLGGRVSMRPVPIPFACRDGFNEAYYGRPERLLEPGARLACSSWSFVDEDTAAAYVAHLAADLRSGAWDAVYGELRGQSFYEGSLVMIVSEPG